MILLLVTGCSAPGLVIANKIAVSVSTAALACDWGQTRAFAAKFENNQIGQHFEKNPILGDRPTPTGVDLYFLGAIGASLLAWRFLPRRWRIALPLVIILGQTKALTATYFNTSGHYYPGLCGIHEALD